MTSTFMLMKFFSIQTGQDMGIPTQEKHCASLKQ